MLVRLIPLDPEESPPYEVEIAPEESITIGRAQMADVRVMALSVGHYVVRLTNVWCRPPACLRAGEGRPEACTTRGIRVDDLDSGGGSSLEVDGEIEPRPHRLLPDGAILRVGQVAFRVELSSGTGSGRSTA